MPLLTEMRSATTASATNSVRALVALTGTAALRRKRDQALRTLEAWRARCERPVLSVSGGKDSTLLLQLAHEVDPTIPVMRADGPVPLSDRAAHVARLEQATPTTAGAWRIVPYTYDVEGVLAGDVVYPAGLKQRALTQRMLDDAVDGHAMGIRADENRHRRLHLARRGTLYRRADGVWVCAPLAWWTAEEVIGSIVAADRLPLNPVYTRTYLQPNLTHLRDGTWLPNQGSDATGFRDWLRWHYPEHLEGYDRAVLVFHRSRRTRAATTPGEGA